MDPFHGFLVVLAEVVEVAVTVFICSGVTGGRIVTVISWSTFLDGGGGVTDGGDVVVGGERWDG